MTMTEAQSRAWELVKNETGVFTRPEGVHVRTMNALIDMGLIDIHERFTQTIVPRGRFGRGYGRAYVVGWSSYRVVRGK